MLIPYNMNNYHIYDEIGRSAHSQVYKGRSKKTIDYLAIKSAEKSRRKKILNEVLIMHSLDHENILRFYNWYETRNHLWVIFEYCSGGSLFTIIEQDKKLPEFAVKDFAFDLLKGLCYLHSNGILYCDLKPSNILFTEYGMLKLADFGLARRLIDLVQRTEPASKKGSPCYMAPELFSDCGVYSFYSDFWGFGCLLYELLTGAPPFVSSSFQELVHMVLHSAVPQVPEASSELNSLLSGLLQKDAWQRITWEELVAHPFWGEKRLRLYSSMPEQPHYEKYLCDKNTVQRGTIDILRISQNIQRNLVREGLKAGEYCSGQHTEGSDVKLNGTDQIVDLGAHTEEGKGPGEAQDLEEDAPTEELKEQQNNEFRPGTQPKLRGTHAPLEEERPSSMHHRSNSNQSSSKSSFVPAALESLVVHSSDTTVKPIVGNKDIERQMEVNYNPQGLNFQVWSREDLVSKVHSSAMDDHFHKIYSSIASCTSTAERLNILNYFESIIINSSVANKLINSAFVDLLIKLLRIGKSSPLKIRICSILGQMIRHSTLISSDLAVSSIFQVLSDQVRDKNERLRRKAMAALGEYLFYAATQMDEEQGDSLWEIPTQIILLVIRTCKPGEDEICRMYATKTIENIAAQSTRAGLKFAIPEVARFLNGIYLNTKNEIFRTSAIVSLSHIVRLNTANLQAVLEKLTVKHIITGLAEDSARLQQGLLTLLLLAMRANGPLLHSLISEEPQFIPVSLKLFEHSAIVVRGKALLLFNFLIKSHPRWLQRLGELKFFVLLEKTMRDNYKYVRSCLYHLLDTVAEYAVAVLKSVSEESRRNADLKAGTMLPVVLQIVNSSAGRHKLNYQACLRHLADLLELGTLNGVTQNILLVLEALGVTPRVLFSHSEFIITQILPRLLAQHSCGDIEIRFRALKIFSDIALPYLYEDSIYDPSNISKATTRLMNELLVKQLIPLYQQYLVDQEPVPLYALKFLSVLIERCGAFVSILHREGLVPLLFSNFESGNSKLNLHLVLIVKKILESKEITLSELVALDMVEKVNSVMKLTLQQDWYVEHVLDILGEVLTMTAEAQHSQQNSTAEALAENLLVCTGILRTTTEKIVKEKALHCIYMILQLYPQRVAESFGPQLKEEFAQVLLVDKPPVVRKVLRVLKLVKDKGGNVNYAVPLAKQLKNNKDSEVQRLANELWV